MKLHAQKLLCAFVAAASMAFSAANALVTFSDVSWSGSLSAGTSYVTGAIDIDFTTPSAVVGDPVNPVRSGTLTVTYVAESQVGMVSDQILITLLGALQGSGNITFTETVEDLVNPGIIATHNDVINLNSQFPYTNTLVFSRPSNRVRATKVFEFSAVDTSALDFAAIALIEQTVGVVPEPTTIGAVALGAVALIRRRKK